METSLHLALKQLYTTGDSRQEAVIEGYRADVLRGDLIVEIQASPLGAIARKVADLVRAHRILVVKPIARRKILIRQSEPGGPWDLRRLSPKVGSLLSVFNELVNFVRVFPHSNLTVEVVLVDEEEFRVPRRRRGFRRPNFRVHDRRLVEIVTRYRLATGQDLVGLLPPGWPNPLTTESLATHLDTPQWFARKVAYTLRHCGIAHVCGKIRNRIVYQLPSHFSATMTAC